MSEEKDVSELEAELNAGHDPGYLPPIPPQLMPSSGRVRRTQRPPGAWLAEHGVTAPQGSFVDAQGRDWSAEWRRLAAGQPAGAGSAPPGHAAAGSRYGFPAGGNG
jgi:phospholipid/cholesterol/gamma-HCH transport system ATP-binding protein